MRLFLRHLRPLSLTVVLAAAAAPAWAQVALPLPLPAPVQAPPPQHDSARRGLSDAVRRAERAGQVLSAEQVQYDGRDVNRVKIVDDQGRVRVYWDDPDAPEASDEAPPARARQKPPRGRTRHDDDGAPTL